MNAPSFAIMTLKQKQEGGEVKMIAMTTMYLYRRN
jgi:hypothetical protein